MAGRGQRSFVSFPLFAARLYDSLMRKKMMRRQYQEIASDLVSRIDFGRILDVGTGPGRLLFEIHQLNPALELFGLDISASMVEIARRHLSGLGADVRRGDIRQSDYEENFFDVVTCTGSFYLWDFPKECLEEIFRILKPRQSAYLFETYRECDRNAVRRAMSMNLEQESLFTRMLAPRLFMKQLRMTYKTTEIAEIIEQTRFAHSYTIDHISLTRTPAWLRIRLIKEA